MEDKSLSEKVIKMAQKWFVYYEGIASLYIFASKYITKRHYMANSQHTIYSHSIRFICIIMLLLVQFDVLGSVVSNYGRSSVTDLIEHTEQGDDKEQERHIDETYFRYGSRIMCSAPQILPLLLPNVITVSTHIPPYIPVDVTISGQQAHAIYCVFLI